MTDQELVKAVADWRRIATAPVNPEAREIVLLGELILDVRRVANALDTLLALAKEMRGRQ